VIEEFLARNDHFRMIDSWRTWPQRQECDGFFIALFELDKIGRIFQD
jgi:16S rRNA C967 or C1407 C5-methylase (RsmB/RsmF family)